MDFLKTRKYPPSLDYLLMTLGPLMLLLYIIHLAMMLVGVASGFRASDFTRNGFLAAPEGFGFGLPGVYLIWALVVLALYPACRWFAGVKAARRDWWLSYL